MRKVNQLKTLLQNAIIRYNDFISEGEITKASKYLALVSKYNGILSDIERYGKSDYITL